MSCIYMIQFILQNVPPFTLILCKYTAILLKNDEDLLHSICSNSSSFFNNIPPTFIYILTPVPVYSDSSTISRY